MLPTRLGTAEEESELAKASDVLFDAYAAWALARAEWDKARAEWDKARAEWDKYEAAWAKACAAYRAAIGVVPITTVSDQQLDVNPVMQGT